MLVRCRIHRDRPWQRTPSMVAGKTENAFHQIQMAKFILGKFPVVHLCVGSVHVTRNSIFRPGD